MYYITDEVLAIRDDGYVLLHTKGIDMAECLSNAIFEQLDASGQSLSVRAFQDESAQIQALCTHFLTAIEEVAAQGSPGD